MTIKIYQHSMINKYKKYNSVSWREWPNSIYTFNKNYEKLSSSKKDTVNKIIKNYFDLTKKENSFKSRRMRNLIKRSSLIKLFYSKSRIKHTNDKINVSLHTFNRKKTKILKNIFSLNKYLNKFKTYNSNTHKRLNRINKYHNINLLKKTKINDYSVHSIKLNLIDYLTPSATNNIKGIPTTFSNEIINKQKKKIKLLHSPLSLYLTKHNNVNYYNIYVKNMSNKTLPNRKNVINKLNKSNKLIKSKKLNTFVNKKTLYKNKKIMIQKKRNLLYKKLIKNFSWSFEKRKTILYKITTLRTFYTLILKSLGLSLNTYLNRKENLYTISIETLNMFNENKYSLDNISIKKNLNIKLPFNYSRLNNKLSISNSKNNKTLMNNLLQRHEINLRFNRYIYINNILEKFINQILNKYISINNNSEQINYLKDNLVNKENTTNTVNFKSYKKNNNMIPSINMMKVIKLKKNLFNEFKKYNMRKLFVRFFGKQHLILNNIYKLYIDNEKYIGLTNSLKYIMNKIYNKKVYLNITELKYLHLNADMLSDAVIVKLINMKNRLRIVMLKTLNLIKLSKSKSNIPLRTQSKKPSHGLVTNNLENNIMPLGTISKNNKTNITFDYLINGMYNSILWNSEKQYKDISINNKTKEILYNLKHKWVTGIKIEGKGRLTNRFSAGRTIFKHKEKGNLRSKLKHNINPNMIYSGSKYINNKVYKKGPYVPLFRGILIPNLQYVRKNSFRRVGAFGVKLWINNNS